MLNDVRGFTVEQYQKMHKSPLLMSILDKMAEDEGISSKEYEQGDTWKETLIIMRSGDGNAKHDLIKWLYDNDYLEGDDRDEFYEDFE
jgi:hypothetical protein